MADKELVETVLSTRRIYSGKILNLEQWQVQLPNGNGADREIVLHKGAAAIVAIDQAEQVVLVRQHRPAVNKVTWEIPAGKLDTAQEDMLEAAQRELREETGITAKNWELLSKIDTTPGFCSEAIGIYFARDLNQAEVDLDEDEFVEVKVFPLSLAVKMIADGQITDAKTICGLLLANLKIKGFSEGI